MNVDQWAEWQGRKGLPNFCAAVMWEAAYQTRNARTAFFQEQMKEAGRWYMEQVHRAAVESVREMATEDEGEQ